jgi:hypothetical protein
MEKQDILIVATAIMAFAILALVVMPMVTGQLTGLPGSGTGGPAVTPTVKQTMAPPATVTPGRGTRPTTTIPTTAPTPAWDGKVKTVGFVGQPEGQVTIPPNPPIPPEPERGRTLVTYAVISGQWSGTTEPLSIPAPYWVLEYTADPMALPPNAYPLLVIQVFDAENPNRVVIEPISQTIYEEPPDDPWSVKIFEGKRSYYFKIDTSFLESYTLTIRIPKEYS